MLFEAAEKIVLLGVSRGLGQSFCTKLMTNHNVELLLISRRQTPPSVIGNKVSVLNADFSDQEDQDVILETIARFAPARLFYFAGGGPYSSFAAKEWKDHLWALEVTFLFPAKCIHWSLNNHLIRQIVCVGSTVAESKADPWAASYAASKHALHGLITSIQGEISTAGKCDLRLFSPNYMDTDLLPKNSWPRHAQLVKSPVLYADALYNWVQNPACFCECFACNL